MDVETAHCAFRLLSMLEAKHPYVRNLDPFTKRTIILITQASPHLKPDNYATLFKSVKKDSFQKDLAFLADRLVNQTLRPLSSPVTTVALAEIDPLSRNVSLHSTTMATTTAIPSLPAIRKSVRDTIDECFRDKSHNPNFTEAKILDALKQLPTEQQSQIKNLRSQLRDAQEEARLYRTMSSATTSTLLSSASSAPSEPRSEHKEVKCFSCEEIGHFGEDCLCTSKHRQTRLEPLNDEPRMSRKPGTRSSNFLRGSQRVNKRASMALSIDPQLQLEPPNLHRDIEIDLFQPLYELSTTPAFQSPGEIDRPQNQSSRESSQRIRQSSQPPHNTRGGSRRRRDSSMPPSQSRDMSVRHRDRASSSVSQSRGNTQDLTGQTKDTRVRAWDGSRRPVPVTALSAHIASIPLPIAPMVGSTALVPFHLRRPNFDFSRLSLGTAREVMDLPMVQGVLQNPLMLTGAFIGLFCGSFSGTVLRVVFKGAMGTVRVLHGVTHVVFTGGLA